MADRNEIWLMESIPENRLTACVSYNSLTMKVDGTFRSSSDSTNSRVVFLVSLGRRRRLAPAERESPKALSQERNSWLSGPMRMGVVSNLCADSLKADRPVGRHVWVSSSCCRCSGGRESFDCPYASSDYEVLAGTPNSEKVVGAHCSDPQSVLVAGRKERGDERKGRGFWVIEDGGASRVVHDIKIVVVS